MPFKLNQEVSNILRLFSVTTLLGLLFGSVLANVIDRIIIPISETTPVLSDIREKMILKLPPPMIQFHEDQNNVDLYPIFLKCLMILVIVACCIAYYHFPTDASKGGASVALGVYS